ncbi:MAG: cation:proton antiporter [Bacteroidales bacterium]|nr:cation:proton antiporter [Bacteroidales bacterium]
MLQTNLIRTTNTLSRINDTVALLPDTIAQQNTMGKVLEQVTTSSSSREIGLTIAIIGLLIFTAHLFSEIFSRKRIPDVLFLIIIGLLIGPVFHWISPESLGNAGNLFSGITLVTILFESGTQLRFSALKDSFKGALKLTALNFVLSAVAIWLTGWLVLDLDPIVSMILGCMLGGTASAVVIPIVRQMRMSEKPAIMLILEAAIGNVFSIVLALALMQAIKSRHVEFGAILGDIFSSFILATVMGLFGAIFWALILDKVRNIKYSILTTPAFVFIIYGINEWMGFSGAIAALAFGIGLANIDSIYNAWLKKFIKKVPVNLNETERSLFSELVLLLKTFFFIYVGISIQLNQWQPIVIGLGISVLLFIIRIPAVRFAISKKEGIPEKEMAFMSALNPKGLTAAVLATQALIYIPDLGMALFVRNIVFSVILFSIVINSILIPLIDKERGMYRFYLKMLSFNQKMKNMVSKTKQDGEEWHKKHSKTHEIVEEMFQSEVISDIIKEQDQPGAINNRPESNNFDVAD